MQNIEDYYGLVVYHVRKIYAQVGATRQATADIELNDLIQEGFVGLFDAARRYDHQRGVAFATFATPRIAGAIRDFLRQLDPLTSRERQRVKELDNVEETLTHELGRSPTRAEMADALGVLDDDLQPVEILRRRAVVSLVPLPGADGSETSGPPESSSPDPTPEETLMNNRLTIDVQSCLQSALADDEQTILTLRMNGDITLQVLSRLLDMPTATVHRREGAAKKK
ncbi:hypothetical protein C2W62_25365 [Candidatus Entotheonella serta]|nr:hypothetical protein C2W62_25365 [Candidatus Entotheonella serta]